MLTTWKKWRGRRQTPWGWVCDGWRTDDPHQSHRRRARALGQAATHSAGASRHPWRDRPPAWHGAADRLVVLVAPAGIDPRRRGADPRRNRDPPDSIGAGAGAEVRVAASAAPAARHADRRAAQGP